MSDYVDTNPVGRMYGPHPAPAPSSLAHGLPSSHGVESVHHDHPPPHHNQPRGPPPPPASPLPSMTRLIAKPHAFAGAVLSPKHARDLNPTLCMAITSSLAEQNHSNSSSSNSNNSNNSKSTDSVPYTLWITEAWRVLAWAEPSAALFWEMATLYAALQAAGRDCYSDSYYHQYYQYHHHSHRGGSQQSSPFTSSHSLQQQQQQQYSSNRSSGSGAGALGIPPILSCGSTGSMTSGATSSHAAVLAEKQKKFSSAVSAKELPVWLVGTFLLLHCEEFAGQRSLSGEDERRFAYKNNAVVEQLQPATSTTAGGRMDFSNFFRNQSLSPRTRLHAGWHNDNTHCTAYLLRHLRKILVLSAVSHNPDALVACMHLAALPTPTDHPALLTSKTPSSNATSFNAGGSGSKSWRVKNIPHSKHYSANDIRRQHDDEHESVGLQIRLTMEDLERLDLVFQPPAGGGIDDPPLKIGEFLWQSMYQDPPPPMASIPLGDVERELRQHLEMELSLAQGMDGDNIVSSDDEDSATNALGRLSLKDSTSAANSMGDDDTEGDDGAATQPEENQYQKELSYTRLRGTTIMLKPNSASETSSGASVASGEQPNQFMNAVGSGRLHDLIISDCTDAHFYLLQPFEHATIAACSGCTIVVGAVAGLLHVVDCEKTTITSAARRILVNNSCDVQMCVFTPSQPILVGDNRTCQFAPYNTYYEGLREDLLATGLAAVVLPDSHHAARTAEVMMTNEVAWPPLQCANNKWKQPIEVSKLEVPQGPNSPVAGALTAPLSPGADDKAMGTNGNDTTLQAPVLVPPSEFNILFVPMEISSDRQQQQRQRKGSDTAAPGTAEDENEAPEDSSAVSAGAASTGSGTGAGAVGSQYCKHLTEVLQLSPFRLPPEYERRALIKAERMKNIQLKVQKHLNAEQQRRFEEELNRGFRDWLVTSGNLRQVLDLVHLDVKNPS